MGWMRNEHNKEDLGCSVGVERKGNEHAGIKLKSVTKPAARHRDFHGVASVKISQTEGTLRAATLSCLGLEEEL